MTIPTPYYERNGITIYHGDCREVLPELPQVSLAIAVLQEPLGQMRKLVVALVPNGSQVQLLSWSDLIRRCVNSCKCLNATTTPQYAQPPPHPFCHITISSGCRGTDKILPTDTLVCMPSTDRQLLPKLQSAKPTKERWMAERCGNLYMDTA